MFEIQINPGDVQYMGLPGMSKHCLLAVDTIVNSEYPPRKASLVTWTKDRQNWQEEHLFLFWDWNYVPLTVVHSGFATGYSGEGSRTFSEALCMIWHREIPTNVIYVDEYNFSAIENRRLTKDTIEMLRNADDSPLSWPWLEYMYQSHMNDVEAETFWARRHRPKFDSDFMDPEISKQCRKLCSQDPGSAVAKAFIVMEERLRSLVAEHGDNDKSFSGDDLITKALHVDNGVLIDNRLSRAEREGMLLLFKGAYQYVRNPRAHRMIDIQDQQLEIEFIYLADLLLRILPDPSSENTGNRGPRT